MQERRATIAALPAAAKRATHVPQPGRRGLFPQGESLIATLGFGSMIILLATLFAAAWLSVREERTLLERTRLEQVDAVVQLIGQSAETMLASEELSGLRRMVVHAARDHRLTSCQIILPDGHVLVDAQPSKVNIAAIPASWPQGPLDLRSAPSTGDEIAVTHSLLVPGRGPATSTRPVSRRSWCGRRHTTFFC